MANAESIQRAFSDLSDVAAESDAFARMLMELTPDDSPGWCFVVQRLLQRYMQASEAAEHAWNLYKQGVSGS